MARRGGVKPGQGMYCCAKFSYDLMPYTVIIIPYLD